MITTTATRASFTMRCDEMGDSNLNVRFCGREWHYKRNSGKGGTRQFLSVSYIMAKWV